MTESNKPQTADEEQRERIHMNANQTQEQAVNEELLFTWEESPENFHTWLEQFTGVDEDTMNYLKDNVKTQRDLDAWIDCFDGDLRGIKRTTNMFASLVH